MIWILVLFCLVTSVTFALAMHDNAGTSGEIKYNQNFKLKIVPFQIKPLPRHFLNPFLAIVLLLVFLFIIFFPHF